MREVLVAPHDPNWANLFEVEKNTIAGALGNAATVIHHIGSTSIPGIYAKPIIDILVEANSIDEVDTKSSEMEAIGFEVLGEFGIKGRRYFRKLNDAGLRLYHVHIFTNGSTDAKRHIAFRDYMRMNPSKAKEYSELKQKLAREFPNDIDGYMDGKDGFIKSIERLARSNTEAGTEA